MERERSPIHYRKLTRCYNSLAAETEIQLTKKLTEKRFDLHTSTTPTDERKRKGKILKPFQSTTIENENLRGSQVSIKS